MTIHDLGGLILLLVLAIISVVAAYNRGYDDGRQSMLDEEDAYYGGKQNFADEELADESLSTNVLKFPGFRRSRTHIF